MNENNNKNNNIGTNSDIFNNTNNQNNNQIPNNTELNSNVSNNKNNSVTIDSTTYTFKSTEADENDVMWACSNDKNSWE